MPDLESALEQERALRRSLEHRLRAEVQRLREESKLALNQYIARVHTENAARLEAILEDRDASK
jgi:hypothetical protein